MGRNRNMTWEEIRSAFPDEWVALTNYRQTGAIEVTGTVIAHNLDKHFFHEEVKGLMLRHHNIAVRYTGKLIKNPDIPLLWQITHTS